MLEASEVVGSAADSGVLDVELCGEAGVAVLRPG
jgi:hypothetical protein